MISNTTGLSEVQSRLTQSIMARLIVVTCVISGMSGCGSSTPAEKKLVYTATGSLEINGKPGADAWVILAPDFEGVPAPAARVGADGKFTLNVYDQDVNSYQEPGDPRGEYHVLIRMPKDPANPISPDRLGGAYGDSTVSKHLVQIELGENELDPIKLENARITD